MWDSFWLRLERADSCACTDFHGNDKWNASVFLKLLSQQGGKKVRGKLLHDYCKQYHTDLLHPDFGLAECQALNHVWGRNTCWWCWRTWDGVCVVCAHTCRINVNHGGVFGISDKQWTWCRRSTFLKADLWEKFHRHPGLNLRSDTNGKQEKATLGSFQNRTSCFHKPHSFACRNFERYGWF